MEAAFGRLHKDGPAAFGGRLTFVDTIMGVGGHAEAIHDILRAWISKIVFLFAKLTPRRAR